MPLNTLSRMASPWARAAATARLRIGRCGARSGVCRPPMALARSFSPITQQAVRWAAEAAAISASASTAAGVSIIAQSAVRGGAAAMAAA